MEIMKGYGLPFPAEYSSCSNLSTELFQWVDGNRTNTGEIEVHMDRALFRGLDTQKHHLKFGWFCESREIVKDVYNDLLQNTERYKNSYRKIFTCDSDLLEKDPGFFEYAPPGSNLPWVKKSEMSIYPKSKICSMIASTKSSAPGHIKRIEVAGQLKDKLDLTGGAHGSPNSGQGYGPNGTWWRSKLDSLKDYMFHVVFENAVYSKYYTEKVTDCFATGTIPIYWGTPKISEDFNPDGIIFYTDDFNIDTLTPELYLSKIDAVKDNFERVKSMKSADDMIYTKIKTFL